MNLYVMLPCVYKLCCGKVSLSLVYCPKQDHVAHTNVSYRSLLRKAYRHRLQIM